MTSLSAAPRRRTSDRLRALVEVLFVFILTKTLVKAYFSLPLAGREFDALHWPYSVQILSTGVALGMVVLLDRSRERYGLAPDWQHDIRLGGGLALLFVAVPMTAMALFGGLVPTSTGLGHTISTVIFQFFLSGIGEEIVYRGYIQSRLNAAFGRPFEVGGIRFGAGLFITALLFGLAHALSGFNPFVRSFHIDLFYGVVTGIWGLVYGLLREKTGSILGAGILHGHEAVVSNFAMTVPGQMAYVLALLITFFALLRPAARQESRAAT